ncbi:MAG: organic solvent tolerance protein [Pseudobdellovibrionaceae bacterium]
MKQLMYLPILLSLLICTTGHTKDLTNRLGVGFKDQLGINLPSLAVQYYPSAETAVAGTLGVDTQDDASKFGAIFRVNRIVFKEEHMNFYMGGGGGLVSQEVAGQNESGFELAAVAGGEFFIPGIDSLGMSFETGIGVTSIKSGVRFRTMADSPLRAGMIFYF